MRFETPLHIGDYKPESYENSESYLRSDTIIAAIISTWAKIGRGDWIGDGDLPFNISSAFPFYYETQKDEVIKYHPFFPRIKRPFNFDKYDLKISKSLKRIVWTDLDYFEKILRGEKLTHFNDNHLQAEFLSDKEVPSEFMYRQISERVQIPRESSISESQPFYMERIHFNKGGLFFLAIGDQLDRLETALNWLMYEGFGTDRNVGNGFFKWEKQDITLSIDSNTNYSTNLGLYCPENKSLLYQQVDENSAYDLIKRGGWITTPGYQNLEKKSIYMFTEGSLFNNRSEICGHPNHNLTPDDYPIDHNIYRCGRTIFLPVKI